MPSFSVSKGNYNHYLIDICDINDNLRHLLAGSNHSNTLRYLFPFLKISFVVIIIAVIFEIYPWIDDYFWYNNRNYYDDENMTLGWVIYFTILKAHTTFMFIVILITVNFKLVSHINTANQTCIIIGFLCSFIFICSLQFLTWLGAKYSLINDSTAMFDRNTTICSKYINCKRWTLDRMIIAFEYPWLVCLIITIYCIVMLCIKCCNRDSNPQKSNHPNQLELVLLKDVSINFPTNDTFPNIETTKGQKFVKQGIWVSFVIVFAWHSMEAWNWFFNLVNYKVFENQYEAAYVILFISAHIFRFILKRLARKLDQIRAYNMHKLQRMNTVWNIINSISFEYFMEFNTSCLYILWYKCLAVYHTPEIGSFIGILFIHQFKEIFLCVIRYSDLYYELKNSFIDKMEQTSDTSLCARIVYRFIGITGWNGNCSLIAWRNRISMDLILRLYASMIFGIIVGVDVKMIGENGIQAAFKTESKYSKIAMYTAISTVSELVHYVAIYCYNYKVYQQNMLLPFVHYVKNMNKSQMTANLLMYLMSVLIWQLYF